MTAMLFEGVILPLLGLGALLSFIRLMLGPSLPDRVVAMDLLSSMAIGLMVAYSIAYDAAVFLDVALVVALITFLGTIAFAYYIDQRS